MVLLMLQHVTSQCLLFPLLCPVADGVVDGFKLRIGVARACQLALTQFLPLAQSVACMIFTRRTRRGRP